MGATLSSRTEWTSASNKGGKLDFSKTNEAVLVEILRYVEALWKEHPREATVLFKRPFVWRSSLAFTDFDKLRHIPNEEYIFRCDKLTLPSWFECCALNGIIFCSDSLIVSAAKIEGGDAHFIVSNVRLLFMCSQLSINDSIHAD